MMLPPSAVVFDLDGTLVDSHAEIAATLARAIASCGLPPIEPLPRSAIGPPLGSLLTSALPGAPPDVVLRVQDAFIRLYDASDFHDTTVFSGAELLLALLAERGVRAFVATAKRASATRRLLGRLRLGPFADTQCVDSRAAHRSKSETVADLVAEHRLVPDETWMIGDTVSDVRAARENGLFAVAATWGYGPVSALVDAQPNLVVGDLAELVALVPKVGPRTLKRDGG